MSLSIFHSLLICQSPLLNMTFSICLSQSFFLKFFVKSLLKSLLQSLQDVGYIVVRLFTVTLKQKFANCKRFKIRFILDNCLMMKVKPLAPFQFYLAACLAKPTCLFFVFISSAMQTMIRLIDAFFLSTIFFPFKSFMDVICLH